MDYFYKEKSGIAQRRTVALERKKAAQSALGDMLFKVYELAVEPSGSTEEARADVQKKLELFAAEVKRRDAEIVALDELEKTIDNALESLKNL